MRFARIDRFPLHISRSCAMSAAGEPLRRRRRERCSSRRRCRTPTARSTSATSWNTSRPTSGCASSGCRGIDVHFVCADDTHGAPIMLRAEAEGVTPQALVARDRGDAAEASLDGFHLSFDHWHSTDSPENVELSQDIYRRLKAGGLRSTPSRSSSSTIRSRRCSCRTATSRARARSAGRRTSTATPARTAARSTRRPI